ncbi:MAG: hypothetical protein Q9168_007285 [Polycauliona sp. 1 TL-2023]
MKGPVTFIVAVAGLVCTAYTGATPADGTNALDQGNAHSSYIQSRAPYYNATSKSIELEDLPTKRSFGQDQSRRQKRAQGLRAYRDNSSRYRVLFRGSLSLIPGLLDAFLDSSHNVAEGLASALKAYLEGRGHHALETYGHYTYTNNAGAGAPITFGVSVREINQGMSPTLPGHIEDFFTQHQGTFFTLPWNFVANAFDLAAVGFPNPQGQGPNARKRSVDLGSKMKRQAATGGPSGAAKTDFCQAPVGNMWNIVDGPAEKSFDATVSC